jgi:hypothetical protein
MDLDTIDELTNKLYESLYSDLEIIENVIDDIIDDLNTKKESYEYVKQKSNTLITGN